MYQYTGMIMMEMSNKNGHHQRRKLLEIEQVILDPIFSGFEGVVLQMEEHDGLFTLLELSVCSGNRILHVSSQDEGLVRGLFERDLKGYRELQRLSPVDHQPQSPSQTRRRLP